MLFPSATVVAALALNVAGAAPPASSDAVRRASAPAAAQTRLASGLWAPPKKSKPKASKDDGEAQEEELLKPRKPAASDTAARKRRPIKMDDSADEGDGGDDEADDGGDDEADGPKVVKRRKRAAEEEEEDVDEPIASEPPIIPRIVNFELGPAILRRSFAYNLGAEQGDKGFRLGYQFGLETFPLVSQPSGWYRTLGVGAWYEKEYGDSTRDQPSGVFMGAAVNHSRWGFDVRYAIPAGESVVVMPALGYGRVGADLERAMPVAPSACTTGNADPCFGDINAAYLSADLHLRVAVTPVLALSLAGGYLQGIGVSRGADQITAEASASMKGFHVELGGTMLLGDYFALTASIPFRRYSFAFGNAPGGAFMAKSAADTYYGVMAGLAVFTK